MKKKLNSSTLSSGGGDYYCSHPALRRYCNNSHHQLSSFNIKMVKVDCWYKKIDWSILYLLYQHELDWSIKQLSLQSNESEITDSFCFYQVQLNFYKKNQQYLFKTKIMLIHKKENLHWIVGACSNCRVF